MNDIVKYFECDECEASYIYAGDKIPFTCGAFVGMVTNKHNETIAALCGGNLNKMTKEQADKKVERLRG